MKKQVIKLTERDLHRIIKKTANKVLKESYNDDDAHISNYNDAMSDRYESLSVDSILSDLRNEGNIDLGECPDVWEPSNWEDVLQYATELGYDSDEVRGCILKHLNSDIKFIQQSIEAVKNWRFRE